MRNREFLLGLVGILLGLIGFGVLSVIASSLTIFNMSAVVTTNNSTSTSTSSSHSVWQSIQTFVEQHKALVIVGGFFVLLLVVALLLRR